MSQTRFYYIDPVPAPLILINARVTAGDSLQIIIQKLQGQITAIRGY